MGGFAAEFRGFWVIQGRGEAIQRTADTTGQSGRKNFLKRGEKPKKWGARGAERASRQPYIEVGARSLTAEHHSIYLLRPVHCRAQPRVLFLLAFTRPRLSTLTLRLRVSPCRILVMTIPIRADRRNPCPQKTLHKNRRVKPPRFPRPQKSALRLPIF